jgi:hypothetical protein
MGTPKLIGAVTLAIAMLAATWIVHADSTLTDAQVRQAIIKESIASYPGRCPCPYNIMSNGRACGGRSAYSRPGGYSPVCFPADVTAEMINEYRKVHGG